MNNQWLLLLLLSSYWTVTTTTTAIIVEGPNMTCVQSPPNPPSSYFYSTEFKKTAEYCFTCGNFDETAVSDCLDGTSSVCTAYHQPTTSNNITEECADCFGLYAKCINFNCNGECSTSNSTVKTPECSCCIQDAGCNKRIDFCTGLNMTAFGFKIVCPFSPTLSPTRSDTSSPSPLLFFGIQDLNQDAKTYNSVVAGSVTGVLCGFTVLVIFIFAFLER
jgi:hypothetical protein